MTHGRYPCLLASLILAWAKSAPAALPQWTPFAPPNPSESGHNFLMGVTAASATDAWAVGYYVQDGDTYSLAMHWDGTDWTVTPTPNPGVPNWGTDCALYAVEWVAPGDVWAAGYKTIAHPEDGVIGGQLLVVHWDGDGWTEIDAPLTPVGGTGAYVREIQAVAPDDIWFTGIYNFVTPSLKTGMVMHWDGSAFTVFDTPDLTADPEKNLSIARAADGDLWVAGMVGRGGWGAAPYVLRGDGDNWEIIGQWSRYTYSDLQTIVAFSDSDAWIGVSKIVDFQFAGYVWLHWDGSSWTEFPVSEYYHEPHLAASGPNDVYSAGFDSLMHWDGDSWSLVDRFDGFENPNMNRLALAPDGSLFGAGRYFPGSNGKTLAARYVPRPVGRKTRF